MEDKYEQIQKIQYRSNCFVEERRCGKTGICKEVVCLHVQTDELFKMSLGMPARVYEQNGVLQSFLVAFLSSELESEL